MKSVTNGQKDCVLIQQCIQENILYRVYIKTLVTQPLLITYICQINDAVLLYNIKIKYIKSNIHKSLKKKHPVICTQYILYKENI